ncbi:MAG: helix-turn-helix domain-containing protein [Phycisphaerae bacterium]|nr:helix-turn-helix domain-containing protein [Phycisphaerae bacterium]
MASKMFYTAEEAAQKLSKSVQDILEMARRGEIQEFRDRDRVMFKVEQINLLAGDDKEGEIPLALEDSRLDESAIDLADSTGGRSANAGKAAAAARRDTMADSSEETGISAFEASRYGQDKKGGGKAGSGELSLETVGSGSGLLDLTRDNDDSLSGANLIEAAFENEDDVQLPANASGLFEAAGIESGGNAVATVGGGMTMMPMMVEAYDGSWSGLGIGLMIGAFAALICALIMAAVTVTGAVPALATMFTGNLLVWGGGLLGVTIVAGLIGFFIGRATE